MKVCALVAFFLLIVNGGFSAGIPIWEYLSREEKLSQIFSILLHLVDLYCKEGRNAQLIECQRTLTLHGVSCLLNKSDHDLDLMDPHQRIGNEMIWWSLMEPDYKLPRLVEPQVVFDSMAFVATDKPENKTSVESDDDNDANPHSGI